MDAAQYDERADYTYVRLTVADAETVARLVRRAEKRAEKEIDPTFVPLDGRRDMNVERVKQYRKLKARFCLAAGMTPDELEDRIREGASPREEVT